MATMAVMEGRHSDLMSGLWTMGVYTLKIFMDSIYNRWVGGAQCTLPTLVIISPVAFSMETV